MMAAIKAELRKLLTVRSTYVILLLCLGLEFFFAFYADGFKALPKDLLKPDHLMTEATTAVSVLSTLVALVGVLLMTHEYRYNTILYTLASARSRTRVLAAKIIVVSLFSTVALVVFGCLSPVFSWLGVHAAGHQLVHQTLPLGTLVARLAFAAWAYAMLALILATLIRVQVGAIAALFLVHGTIEQLIGLVLKNNQVYLPFSAVSAVLTHTTISYGRAALVALAWVVVGWLVAWQLFLRRDAN